MVEASSGNILSGARSEWSCRRFLLRLRSRECPLSALSGGPGHARLAGSYEAAAYAASEYFVSSALVVRHRWRGPVSSAGGMLDRREAQIPGAAPKFAPRLSHR